MSLGYAEKLSFIEDVGKVGMTEHFDPPHILREKIERLATMIQKSKHLVVFTGAGISTSCGIPDFRGPKGIWTLQRDGKALPEASLPFHRAMPSSTHMALVELEKAGVLKFLISQNIDGLHLRSGISREKLSELHGNSFMEICPSCGFEYMRDFEVETIGLKETSRRCSNAKCGAKLKDTVLDWEYTCGGVFGRTELIFEYDHIQLFLLSKDRILKSSDKDALPPKEMNPAEKHCRIADVVLCLGTSLQITPACNLPLKSLRGGGKIIIVNLQKTPKDKKASLVIHGLVDKVIAGVMEVLNLQIPPFIRIDLFQITLAQGLSMDKKFVNWTLRIASVHGHKAPLPFINSVEVSFLDNLDYKAAVLDRQPFLLKRRTVKSKTFDMVLQLNFGEGCGCSSIEIKIPVDFKISKNYSDLDKETIFKKLKESALQDLSCGGTAIVEKKATLAPKTETTRYAIVTNVLRYEGDSTCDGGSSKRQRESGINGTVTTRKRSKKRKEKSRS